MENGANDAISVPSLTEIIMFSKELTSPTSGMPCKRPVLASNVVHSGWPVMLKVIGSLSGSLAVGTNSYCSPTNEDVAGAPAIVGRELTGGGDIGSVVAVVSVDPLQAANIKVAKSSIEIIVIFENRSRRKGRSLSL